jgi:hypothetical protein
MKFRSRSISSGSRHRPPLRRSWRSNTANGQEDQEAVLPTGESRCCLTSIRVSWQTFLSEARHPTDANCFGTPLADRMGLRGSTRVSPSCEENIIGTVTVCRLNHPLTFAEHHTPIESDRRPAVQARTCALLAQFADVAQHRLVKALTIAVLLGIPRARVGNGADQGHFKPLIVAVRPILSRLRKSFALASIHRE